jgi:hypothetical protein
LQSYSPFYDIATFTDPKLVELFILDGTISLISLSEKDWKRKIIKALARDGVCRLRSSNNSSLRSHLIELLSEPIDVDFLQLFVMIVGIQREKRDLIITLKLKEEW